MLHDDHQPVNTFVRSQFGAEDSIWTFLAPASPTMLTFHSEMHVCYARGCWCCLELLTVSREEERLTSPSFFHPILTFLFLVSLKLLVLKSEVNVETCILANSQQGGDSFGCINKCNDSPHWIYYLTPHFMRLMVSILSLKYSSFQHDVHFVNDGPI